MNPRFISPRTDFGFKKLLGSAESKESMIAFINSIYPELEVVDLDFLRTECVADEHESIIDLLCETKKNKIIAVEIQLARQKNILDHTLFYASRLISEVGNRVKYENGKWSYVVDALYVIGVLDIKLPETITDRNSNRCIWEYSLIEKSCYRQLPVEFDFAFIELPSFNKKIEELSGIQDKMLYLLRHLDMLEERPESFGEEFFSKMFSMAEFSNLSEEERTMYIDEAMNINDYYNSLDFAREQGEEKGREEGRAEGMEKGLEKARLENGQESLV